MFGGESVIFYLCHITVNGSETLLRFWEVKR